MARRTQRRGHPPGGAGHEPPRRASSPGSGPDAAARAARSARVADRTVGWVRPLWLERQEDPRSTSFVPRGERAPLTNLTHRSWTDLGTPTSSTRATVDERGLVTPWPGGWSLDWWIGADDRWHLPSREAAVRQRLLDGAPVVETAMRVPGGDALHRAYVTKTPGGEQDVVVVEVENATSIPFAVAFSIRPWNPLGAAPVNVIGLDDERTVLVDGRVALHVARPPARAAASTGDGGDVAAIVLAGDAGSRLPDEVRCDDGLATAAVLFPLPHTATVRVVIPLRPVAAARARVRGAAAPAPLPSPLDVAPADQVARGWRVVAERGARFEVPDDRLAAALAACRRSLLLAHPADLTDPATPLPFDDVAAVLGALGRVGAGAEVAAVLRTLPDRQRQDGRYAGAGDERVGTGAALAAVAEHVRLSGDATPAADVAGSLAAAVRWLVKGATDRGRGAGGRRAPAGGAGDLGALWGLRGVLDAAEALAAAGEARAADDVAALGARLAAGVDPRSAEAPLAACWPLRLAAPDAPGVAAAAEALRGAAVGAAVAPAAAPTGLSTRATLQLGLVELEAGDRRALTRLRWLLEAAGSTWTWPTVVHPRTGGGCAGEGDDRLVAADLVTFVRNLLVRDVPGGLALCTLLPDGWAGAGVEVHDAPTHVGRLSYALRWHGDRPALLWEVEPREGAAPPTLTAPGLDPSWSSTGWRGEALLAPYVLPAPPDEEPAGVDPDRPGAGAEEGAEEGAEDGERAGAPAPPATEPPAEPPSAAPAAPAPPAAEQEPPPSFT